VMTVPISPLVTQDKILAVALVPVRVRRECQTAD
jgi:hypothetical protein